MDNRFLEKNDAKGNEVYDEGKGIDCRYDDLPQFFGVFGAHWPIILQFVPVENPDAVRCAAAYLKRCSEHFGAMLSKDIGFCASQALYKRYIKMDVCKDAAVFDLESVPEAEGRKDCFYINARLTPIRIEGASLAEYEQHEDFCTYKITP